MDDLAERLAVVANELVVRVRDDDPAAVHRWLVTQVGGLNEWIGLAMILAAAVPDDRSWSQLVGWIAGTEDPAERRRRQWRESSRRRRAKAS